MQRQPKFLLPPKAFDRFALLVLSLWFLLTAATPYGRSFFIEYSGYFQLGFYALSLFALAGIYRHCLPASRKLFLLLMIAMIGSYLGDSITYSANILHTLYFGSLPFTIYTLHDLFESGTVGKVLYIGYMMGFVRLFLVDSLLLIFLYRLLRIFFGKKLPCQYRFIIFTSCFILAVLALLYFNEPDQLPALNAYLIAHFVAGVFDIGIFIIAMYLLMHSKNASLNWLLTSFILMASEEFSTLYYFSYLHYNNDAFFFVSNLLWVTWMLLAFLAFYRIYIKQDYEVKTWLIESNTLEARLAFTTFIVASFSMLICFTLALHFNFISSQKFIGTFLFVMMYSLIAVMISKRIAKTFATPFHQLQSDIDALINRHHPELKMTEFELAEFNYLQNFIYQRFTEHEAQAAKIKAMGQMAVQVAHDIRSPAAAIMMLAKESADLPERQRIALREAAHRVQDIANNLLSDYRGEAEPSHSQALMLVPTVLSVISEKRMQYREHPVQFFTDIATECHFTYVKVNATEFKRMLSNLINNAVEAIAPTTPGEIRITIKPHAEQICLVIRDNGKGMSPELINKLNDQSDIASTKKAGSGLGIKHAKTFMHAHHSQIHFNATPEQGSDVTLYFKPIATPCWLAQNIAIASTQEIVVLDDDISIHEAWNQRFMTWQQNYPELKITHFYSGHECLTYLQSLSQTQRDSILLLTDYELINQNITGLEVIEQVTVERTILVTSHHDNAQIIKRAILSNTRILPKLLAADTPIRLLTIMPTAAPKVDAVILEDRPELRDSFQFLASQQHKILAIYATPYELWEQLHCYPHDTIFCLDYDLDIPVNGIEIAEQLRKMGYQRLYLTSGYSQMPVPEYLTVLPDKMAIMRSQT